jgi:hypothetical protein
MMLFFIKFTIFRLKFFIKFKYVDDVFFSLKNITKSLNIIVMKALYNKFMQKVI